MKKRIYPERFLTYYDEETIPEIIRQRLSQFVSSGGRAEKVWTQGEFQEDNTSRHVKRPLLEAVQIIKFALNNRFPEVKDEEASFKKDKSHWYADGLVEGELLKRKYKAGKKGSKVHEKSYSGVLRLTDRDWQKVQDFYSEELGIEKNGRLR